jgi:protein-S-isoprenylcysteine O-methyltransferase Ste14
MPQLQIEEERMAQSPTQDRTPERPRQDRAATIWRLAVVVVASPLLMAWGLFAVAGTLDWWQGWLYSAVVLAVNSVIVPYTWRVNPDLVVARSRFRFAKGWDKVLTCFLVPSLMAIFVVAALDSGRFHWLPIPWWACAAGYVLYLLAIVLLTWVGAVNKFAEPGVRIQTERGHKVIDTGPYAIVRHPGYVATMPLFAGTALALGSVWALLPASVVSVLLLLRTQWEDQTLQAELPGYKEYTQRVRYRLVPGLW